MTDQELKDIVAAVVAELEKSGVDFDYKAEQAEDDDLVFVIRGTAPNYQGLTVTWKGLLDIITAQATQAKNDAETAKNAANTILEQVQSKGTEITNFVATSKAELETQKNESVNAVKSVYQTDLNELKGDLVDVTEEYGKNIFNPKGLLKANGWQENNGVFSGQSGKLTSAFGDSKPYFEEFEPNKRYTLSLKAYTDGSASQSGQGVVFEFYYTDGSITSLLLPNNTLTESDFFTVSSMNKSITKLIIKHSSGGNNVWYLKNIQLEIGDTKTEYSPYTLSAIDLAARAKGKENTEMIESVSEYVNKNLTEFIYSYGTPVFKHINASGMLENNNNKNISFEEPVFAKKGSTITVDDGYKFQIALYNKTNGSFIKRITWLYSDTTYILDDDYLVRLEISDMPESVLSDTGIFSHLKYSLIADKKQKVDVLKERVDILENGIAINNVLKQFDNIINAIGLNSFKRKTNEVVSPKAYNAWPFVVPLHDKLMLFYSRGNSHTDTTGFDIYASTSQNGIVWSEQRAVFNTENVREGITGKGTNSNGDVLVWVRTGNPGSADVKHDLYRTGDGITFEKVSSPIFPTVCQHIGDILQIPNTHTLVCFYNTYGTTRSWGMLKSLDDGVTWEQIEVETNISSDKCPVEITATYVGENKILAMGRRDIYTDDNTMFQLQSSNLGSNWSKLSTNITDIGMSTPSIINESGNLSLYYFHRGAGKLRLRKSNVSDIWDNPLNWNSSEVIAIGTTNAEDTGNVNACAFKDYQIATYYSGDSSNTGIYTVLI